MLHTVTMLLWEKGLVARVFAHSRKVSIELVSVHCEELYDGGVC